MKKAFLSALLLAGAAITLNSCSSGDYNANPSGAGGGTNQLYTGGGSSTSGGGSTGGGSVALGTFIATINGTKFTASFANSIYNSGLGLQIIGSITTSPSNSKIVHIVIFNYAGPGTYDIDGLTTAVSYQEPPANTPIPTTSGQIIITSEDATSYQGTFEGTGSGLTITDGKFNVKK